MKSRSRLVLPLLAAGVLLAVALAVVLWPAPSVPPAPVEAAPVVEAPPAASAPVAPAPRAQPAPAAPAPVSAPAAQEAEQATVVPVGPGDEVPEPEREGPPQQNDPIEPEKPQTARWKLAKTERISSLLGRDVERLERERELADSRGNAEEAQRLSTLIQRHRAHLEKLRQDMAQLAEAARNEPPEP